MRKMPGWGAQGEGWRKGPWTSEEDKLLIEYVNLNGEGRWSSVAKSTGLNRSGKSCRLRWVNYLRPGLKRGHITPQEEGLIIELHALWGNKWSTIARYLPGRTDNEIKNYWRTHFKKKEKSSQKQEKRKAQILKQQQQQQQLLIQPQKEDMKRTLPQANTATLDNMNEAQGQQDMMLPCPNLEDHYYLPVMTQIDDLSWSNSMLEEGLWGGLWNLDDPPAHQNHTINCNKIASIQNQASLFNFAGDSNFNLPNGGYIF